MSENVQAGTATGKVQSVRERHPLFGGSRLRAMRFLNGQRRRLQRSANEAHSRTVKLNCGRVQVTEGLLQEKLVQLVPFLTKAAMRRS